MDRQQTIGFILITFILVIWMWWIGQNNTQQNQPKNDKTETVKKETPKTEEAPAPEILTESKSDLIKEVSVEEKIITIETDLYVAQISSKGGTIKKWQLKNYSIWNKKQKVELIDTRESSNLNILFTSTDGKNINTKNYNFEFTEDLNSKIVLAGDKKLKIGLKLKIGEGEIIKSFIFSNTENIFDFNLYLKNLKNTIANYEYQVEWENGIPYSERNSLNESSEAKAFIYSAGEVKELDVANLGDKQSINPTGTTDWVAAKSKYFALAIIPQNKKATAAFLSGEHIEGKPIGSVEIYNIALTIPFKGETNHETNFKIFLGPLEYKSIKSLGYNLEEIMSLGWRWVRPITIYIFIPLFNFLHNFVSNFGVVIIIFTIILKVLLFPLTRTTAKSMQKMQALAPMIEEIKQKYKNDQNQVGVQTMKLYREYGVNPAGGCLPLLLQMPILTALYSMFSNAIELRQSEFALWMNDLSVPDVIFSIPFKIPLLGLQDFSGLALAMGLTMFIQQKMTVTDPRQKMLVWMMPAMMTLLFNNFPAGLNLYYFAFNILAIVEQMYYKKKKSTEPLKKVERKKGGWGERLQQKLETAQRAQRKK